MIISCLLAAKSKADGKLTRTELCRSKIECGYDELLFWMTYAVICYCWYTIII